MGTLFHIEWACKRKALPGWNNGRALLHEKGMGHLLSCDQSGPINIGKVSATAKVVNGVPKGMGL